MEEKNSLKTVLIVILVLLVLGLGGYIIYDKKAANETNKSTKSETTKVESENLDAVAQELVNKLDTYYVDYYDYLGKADFSAMSNSDKLLGAFVYGNDFNLSKKTVDDYFNNLFGITLTEYPDLQCWSNDGVYAKYNSSKNDYETQENHNHGGIEGKPHSDIIKYNNIQKNGDNYIITVTKVFGPNLKDSDGFFYSDYNYSTKIEGLNQFGEHELTDAEKNTVKNYYEQNYDQFKNLKPQYKYTFKKENNNHYLVSYESIN